MSFSRIFTMLALMAFAMSSLQAQTLPSADVDTVNSGMGEESLAPIPMKESPVPDVRNSVGSEAAAPGGDSDDEVADAVEKTDPFLVKGLVITLSGTTGFDRDAALEQGARDALPNVLVGMGVPADKAAKNVKSLGSAMRFVKGYKVVKESLIPVYTLTADISFNGVLLQKNFGGKLPSAKDETAVKPAIASEAVDVSNIPVRQWVVRISERNPAMVDKVRTNLNSQPSTRAVYRLLTSAGAELLVDTPLDAQQVRRFADAPVEVVALEMPIPAASTNNEVQRQTPWQGQNVEGSY